MTAISDAVFKAMELKLQEAQTEVDLRGVLLQKSGKLLKNAVKELDRTLATVKHLHTMLDEKNNIILEFRRHESKVEGSG